LSFLLNLLHSAVLVLSLNWAHVKKKYAKEKSRADGCSTSDLVRQFRHKFKIDIQFAIAAGLGAMIQVAGQPWGDLGSA